MSNPVRYGPGFERMRSRMGRAALASLRRKVVAEQEAALVEASTRRPVEETTDRTTYKDYPATKPPPRRKK